MFLIILTHTHTLCVLDFCFNKLTSKFGTLSPSSFNLLSYMPQVSSFSLSNRHLTRFINLVIVSHFIKHGNMLTNLIIRILGCYKSTPLKEGFVPETLLVLIKPILLLPLSSCSSTILMSDTAPELLLVSFTL